MSYTFKINLVVRYGSKPLEFAKGKSGLRQRLHVTIRLWFVDTPLTSDFKKGFLWAKPSTVVAKIMNAIERKAVEVYVP